MQIYHDSHDSFFRAPFGAVVCQSKVRIRLKVSDVDIAPQAVLRLWNAHEQRFDMRLLGAVDGAFLYETVFTTSEEPCLMWYRFEVYNNSEHVIYGNAHDHLGGVGQIGNDESYQVTVYDPAFDTPHWMREGIIYQIMVDRFYNGDTTHELIKKRNDIRVHKNWYERPSLEMTSGGDNRAFDFFGGNLIGVRKKLGYLKSMGVSAIYFNPIFKANSNHKYDTGDYRLIDPMFGDETEFTHLCNEAKAMGIRVMLDGVFSHVGDDSIYFNRYGNYDEVGAYQSKDSPYYKWFTFENFPDKYDCWWGFVTLPTVRKNDPDFENFILTGEDAVVKHYLRAGASGWRLDVADELPMEFLRTLRQEAKSVDPDAAVLGEVWEDASNKVAYGQMRSYVLGDTLDSVMNYPLRTALIEFLLGRSSAAEVARSLTSLQENYPLPFAYSLMNLMGSHDRARIVNVLCERDGDDLPRFARAKVTLTKEQRAQGMRRSQLMLRIIAALPGMPCIYYGDEALVEGCSDPYCRHTFPWGQEDKDQLSFFHRVLGNRSESQVLKTGLSKVFAPCSDVLGVIRYTKDGKDAFGDALPSTVHITLINRSTHTHSVYLPTLPLEGIEQLTQESGERISLDANGALTLTLGPLQGCTYFA